MPEQTSEQAEVAYRSRWDVCDDCDTVTIIERDDARGVPEEFDGFPECLVCGASLTMGNADETTIADAYWAKGKRAGRAEAVRLVEAALGANAFGHYLPEWRTDGHNGAHDVVRVDAIRAALDPGTPPGTDGTT